MILIIAFITMFIDHIWMIFFPEIELLRIIWRIAFPLFAWWIVRWFKLTKNKEKYTKRIFVLAIISQIPLFFMWIDLYNVCFTLLFWLSSLIILNEKKILYPYKVLFISLMLLISNYLSFDYWIYWILTIILIYLTWWKKISVLYFFILTFLFYCFEYTNLNIIFNIQIYAVFWLVLVYLTPIQKYDFKLNFYFKYWFYPIHLAILYMIYFFTI